MNKSYSFFFFCLTSSFNVFFGLFTNVQRLVSYDVVVIVGV